MPQQTVEYLTDLEKQANFYLGLIRRIDLILEGPVKTLIRITGEYVNKNQEAKEPTVQELKDGRVAEGFPVWMTEDIQPEPRDDLFSKALCFATIQEITRLQRRFPWIGRKEIAVLRKLVRERDKEGHNQLFRSLIPERYSFADYVKKLSSSTFGALNPLTSSQVFQVLLNDGEAEAHGALGFLAFFSMIWPLKREFPDPQNFGAAIEPWQPKAYITAKCILPIKSLQNICIERAELLNGIIETLEQLKERSKSGQNNPNERWLFNAGLDVLSAKLSRLSSIVIDRESLRDCAKAVKNESDKMSQQSNPEEIYEGYKDFEGVRNAVGKALKRVGEVGVNVLTDAGKVLADIETEIIPHLLDRPHGEEKTCLENMGLKFAREYMRSQASCKEYLEDLQKAAKKALEFCRKAFDCLYSSCLKCENINEKDLNSITEAARVMADANKQIAGNMGKLVREATAWCHTVADREIAHASARNLTDFDPSELVSAIAVAIKWNKMTTNLQVADAVSKALAGAREDGSWSPGQPFYSPNNAMGIWPATSDIVLTLTTALDHFPDVEIADEALFNYVDWLERTRTELNLPDRPDEDGFRDNSSRRDWGMAIGWASDRLRHPRKIHFPTTAFSINALFKIRELIEYRLWQLCERRFTVIHSHDGLEEVDPVDLGAKHEKRLHRRLASIARESQGGNYNQAEYSLVLHGPPGSSKTFIAKALSVEMWKATRPWGSVEKPRLIRITPADFTRLGEDRLDSEARLIFDLLSGIRGVTIFFDEIDDLLRKRNAGDPKQKPSFMELVVPAMLNRLADLREACPRQEICFLLATNFVETIEPALIRNGRIDGPHPVVYPDYESRLALITKFSGKLKNERAAKILVRLRDTFALKTARWPYLSIKAAFDLFSETLETVIVATATEMTKANQKEPTFEEVVNKVVKDWRAVMEESLTEIGSSIAEPMYKGRWDNNNKSSQELLDEHAHYIISGFPDSSGFEEWKSNNSQSEDLLKRISAILEKEGRLRL